MVNIIAYGAWGKNRTFKTKQNAMGFFGIGSVERLDRIIRDGDMLRDPASGQEYFLDEIEVSKEEFFYE